MCFVVLVPESRINGFAICIQWRIWHPDFLQGLEEYTEKIIAVGRYQFLDMLPDGSIQLIKSLPGGC